MNSWSYVARATVGTLEKGCASASARTLLLIPRELALPRFLVQGESGGTHPKEVQVRQQRNIYNDREIRDLVEIFSDILQGLHKREQLRHGLAAMALTMQQEMTRYTHRGVVAHDSSLELIMRGVFSALTGDGDFSHHPIEKLTHGYIGLMLSYHEERRQELYESFKKFEDLLKNR